jgi:FdhD protein
VHVVDDGTAQISLLRSASGTLAPDTDHVAREEPLEIRVGGVSIAVVMRTPGHDLDLVRGFLVGEGIVGTPGDILSLRHCSEAPSLEEAENIVQARLAEGVDVDLEELRRNLFASSSCGICGKASIESVLAVAGPLEDESRFPAETFVGLGDALRSSQPVFAQTGGLHAAALFEGDGTLLVVREDVGRHNAVDKVIGWAFDNGLVPLSGHVLMLSGRISFEVVQKALAARIPVIAAISAPTSLAVSLAEESGIALVGFLREGRLNVYGNLARVTA